MISKKLKETLSNSGKFLTLSLTITLLKKCLGYLTEYGIGIKTLSFFQVGMDSMGEELKEGYKFVETKENFDKLIGDNFEGGKKE